MLPTLCLLTCLLVVAVGGLLLYRAVRFRGLLARAPFLPRFVRFKLQSHTLLGRPCRTDLVLDRDGFSLGYDYALKSARWASYVVSEASMRVGDEKVDRADHAFSLDPDVPREHQHASSDYIRSGYDRGHLVPSETVDFTNAACAQTFAMSNIVPQHPNLNRRAWRSLENDVRRWTETLGRLVVVVGPIYDDPPKRRKGLAVPSHLYKVVYSPDHHRCVAFVLPNREVAAAQRWAHACSVRDVEKAAKLRFFRAWWWLGRRPDVRTNDVDWWKAKR